jgi:hypothetical protein
LDEDWESDMMRPDLHLTLADGTDIGSSLARTPSRFCRG